MRRNDEQGRFSFAPPEAREYPALTVRQPWAWAIASGLKTIENRPRRIIHRGDLLIHAGQRRFDPAGLSDEQRAWFPELPRAEDLAYGQLVALARVVDCVPYAKVKGQPFAEGPWCWILEDVRPIVPVPWMGSLSLFYVAEKFVQFI